MLIWIWCPIPCVGFSTLGCILKNRFKFCGDYLTKDKMKQFCDQEWTQYNLDDREWWTKNRSFKYGTILQLMLFCRWEGKWDEVMYVSAFMSLYQDLGSQMECGKIMLCYVPKIKGRKGMINAPKSTQIKNKKFSFWYRWHYCCID